MKSEAPEAYFKEMRDAYSQPKNACFSINRKGGYVTIHNNGSRYPLRLWEEYRGDHDLTHQQVANQLLAMENETRENSDAV
jgi:hypothetical protein